jgi:hypothetical protein
VKLDIQFLTKEIHLLSTLIFKDESLTMLKNGVLNIYRAPVEKKNVLFGFRTIKASDYRAFGLSDLRTLDLRNIGPSDYLTFALLDLRTIGPSPYQCIQLNVYI